MRYLKAVLVNGDEVTGEFSKLAKVQKYVMEVFSGVKPFNVWSTVSEVIEATGEKAVSRTRQMIAGSQIASITEVDENGDEVVEVQRGKRGRLTISAELATITGLAEGLVLPKHRQQIPARDSWSRATFRDYVVVKAASEDGTEPEVRFYIGDTSTTVVRGEPGDAEDDVDPISNDDLDGGENYDDGDGDED